MKMKKQKQRRQQKNTFVHNMVSSYLCTTNADANCTNSDDEHNEKPEERRNIYEQQTGRGR